MSTFTNRLIKAVFVLYVMFYVTVLKAQNYIVLTFSFTETSEIILHCFFSKSLPVIINI